MEKDCFACGGPVENCDCGGEGSEPKHKTVILRNNRGFYIVRCNLCGRIGTEYKYHMFAEHRKSTHDRGQDSGSNS